MNSTITAVLTLIIGLLGGYYTGVQLGSAAMHAEMGNMHGAMEGMMTGMQGKTGATLEKAFLEEMIVHHEGAVEMAQELLKGTQRPELVKMGNDIITVQTKEIEQMKAWKAAWF